MTLFIQGEIIARLIVHAGGAGRNVITRAPVSQEDALRTLERMMVQTS
jgi:hypothetical protein